MTTPTQAQVDATVAAVVAALKTGGTIAATVDPALLPAIVVGQAVLTVVPDLTDDVIALLNGGNTPITPAQDSAIVQSILSLANPAVI